MKAYLVILVVSCGLSLTLFAKGRKNEIGIGIGYIEMSLRGEKINYLTLEGEETQRTLLSQLAFTPYREFSPRYYRYSTTLPAIYYSYQLQRRLQFRISFQLSYAKTRTEEYFLFDQSKRIQVTIKQKLYDLSYGFFYSYILRKEIQLGTGIGFNFRPQVEYASRSYLHHEIDSQREVIGSVWAFLSESISIPLGNKFNAKYDISIMSDAEKFTIRPFNRLSINYTF